MKIFVKRIVSGTCQFSSVAQLCPTLCDPMDCNTPGLPVLHHLLELTQTHVHQVGNAIQPSHLLSSPSSPAFNLSQHQGLFQWISSSPQEANKKSHYLWSASWRNKRASGITQSESKCPRTKGVTDGIPSLKLKAWKPGATNVSVRVQKSKNQGLWCSRAREDDFAAKKKGREFTLPSLFVPFKPQQIVWCPPTLVGVEVFAQSKTQKLVSPKNTFTVTPRNNVTPAIWTIFSPIKLTYKINRL